MANKGSFKHGMSGSKLHYIWKGMRQRCLNPNNKDYHNYGMRGISISNEWMEFLGFYKWSVQSGYKDGLTIERIDVNDGYFPHNCKWIENKKQARNTRKLVLLEYNGCIRPLVEWAEIFNISSKTIKGRLSRGWSISNALNVRPVKGRNQYG